MNLKKSFLSILALFLFAPMAVAQETTLLKGHVDVAAPTQVTMIYDHDGDVIVNETETDADGNFQFIGSLPSPTKNAFLYINAKPYGAFLEKGKIVEMDIKATDVVFKGDNIPENEYVNTYQQVFFSGNFKLSPEEIFDYANSKEKLQSSYDKVLEKINHIRPEMKEDARDLASNFRDHYSIQLMRMDRDGVDHTKEYKEIIAKIDPNADNSRYSGIIKDWYNEAPFLHNMQQNANSLADIYADIFKGIDASLSNNANKKNLYNNIGTMFFMYQPAEEDVNKFLTAVEPLIADSPILKKNFMDIYESMKVNVHDGDLLPTDPTLIAPDGSTCKLSNLLGKNTVYIDIWATWCRPCCAEIPHLEKLVERFKGNDKISFISISQDDDKDKWLRKVEKDNPQWPQYIFEPKSGEEFLKAMTINAIPRFLIIGKDRRIISIDAQRPSSENIDNILTKASE